MKRIASNGDGDVVMDEDVAGDGDGDGECGHGISQVFD